MLGAEDARHRAERAGHVAQNDDKARGAAIRTLAPCKVEPVGVDSARERIAADDVDFDLFILAP